MCFVSSFVLHWTVSYAVEKKVFCINGQYFGSNPLDWQIQYCVSLLLQYYREMWWWLFLYVFILCRVIYCFFLLDVHFKIYDETIILYCCMWHYWMFEWLKNTHHQIKMYFVILLQLSSPLIFFAILNLIIFQSICDS